MELIRLCEHLGQLPDDGGVLSQDSLYIFLVHRVIEFDKIREDIDARSKAATGKA